MMGKPGTCLTAPAPLENDEGEVDGGDDMNATGSGAALRERPVVDLGGRQRRLIRRRMLAIGSKAWSLAVLVSVRAGHGASLAL